MNQNKQTNRVITFICFEIGFWPLCGSLTDEVYADGADIQKLIVSLLFELNRWQCNQFDGT